jgi:hypothetical protein
MAAEPASHQFIPAEGRQRQGAGQPSAAVATSSRPEANPAHWVRLGPVSGADHSGPGAALRCLHDVITRRAAAGPCTWRGLHQVPAGAAAAAPGLRRGRCTRSSVLKKRCGASLPSCDGKLRGSERGCGGWAWPGPLTRPRRPGWTSTGPAPRPRGGRPSPQTARWPRSWRPAWPRRGSRPMIRR